MSRRLIIQPYVLVNGTKIAWEENMTVPRVLELMNYTFRLLVVKVNGVLIKRKDYHTTLIPKNAEVKVIHMVAGG